MSVLQAAIVDQLRRLRELEEAIAVELRKSVRRLRPSAEPRASLYFTYKREHNVPRDGAGPDQRGTTYARTPGQPSPRTYSSTLNRSAADQW